MGRGLVILLCLVHLVYSFPSNSVRDVLKSSPDGKEDPDPEIHMNAVRFQIISDRIGTADSKSSYSNKHLDILRRQYCNATGFYKKFNSSRNPSSRLYKAHSVLSDILVFKSYFDGPIQVGLENKCH